MKNGNIIRSVLIIFFSVYTISGVCSQENRKIIILHSNDLHSRIDGFAPSSDYSPMTINNDNTRGGFSRLAAMIKREKALNPEEVLVLDAGDFLMGTFYHYMEEYNPFQLRLMKQMGYDVLAFGNHEFDYGPDRLAGIILSSATEGDIPQLLMSNAIFDKKDTADDKLQDLYISNLIRNTVIIEKNGVRLGLFALLGEDADNSAPYAVPVRFEKNIKAAKRLTSSLIDMGCDIIICLSHSGIEKNENGEWAGEDVELARKVEDIDLIISGHTHTVLTEPLVVGKTVIVQTGSYGLNLGRVEFEVGDEGVSLSGYKLMPVDDSITGDTLIQEEIIRQKKLISDKLYEAAAFRIDDNIVETDFRLECNETVDPEASNLGPLVADAIYSYVNDETEQGTDISLVATGVIRDAIVPGVQTTQDIFRVMSLGSGRDEVPGYPLSRVYLNARELKRVLEILMVAYKSTPAFYCYYSGLEVKYDPSRGILRKINSISIKNKNGEMISVDMSKNNNTLYSITASSYTLEFIGIIQKMTYGFVKVKPKDAFGNEIADMSDSVIDFDSGKAGIQEGKEWIALVKYLRSMKDTDGNGIPDINDKYRDPGVNMVTIQ